MSPGSMDRTRRAVLDGQVGAAQGADVDLAQASGDGDGVRVELRRPPGAARRHPTRVRRSSSAAGRRVETGGLEAAAIVHGRRAERDRRAWRVVAGLAEEMRRSPIASPPASPRAGGRGPALALGLLRGLGLRTRFVIGAAHRPGLAEPDEHHQGCQGQSKPSRSTRPWCPLPFGTGSADPPHSDESPRPPRRPISPTGPFHESVEGSATNPGRGGWTLHHRVLAPICHVVMRSYHGAARAAKSSRAPSVAHALILL